MRKQLREQPHASEKNTASIHDPFRQMKAKYEFRRDGPPDNSMRYDMRASRWKQRHSLQHDVDMLRHLDFNVQMVSRNL